MAKTASDAASGMSAVPAMGEAPLGAALPDGVARVTVTDIARSLAFYHALGGAVRLAADGWALLCCGGPAIVLIHAPAGPPGRDLPRSTHRRRQQPVRLAATNLQAVRRRLLAAGWDPGTTARCAATGQDELTLLDPDHHRVVLDEMPAAHPSRSALRSLGSAAVEHGV